MVQDKSGIWGKKGIVPPGQVKETSKRRAELKEERGARMRRGLCSWERSIEQE